MPNDRDRTPSTAPRDVSRTRTGPRLRGAHGRRPTWRRTRLRLGLSITGILLVLVVLDLLWAAYSVAANLSAAQDELLQGATELVAGNVDEATSRFADAAAAAQAAESFGFHPSVKLLGALPPLRDNVDAIEELSSAAHLAADGAGSLARAAEIIGWDGSSTSAMAAAGSIDLEPFKAAGPLLEDARTRFSDAQAQVDSVATAGLIPALQSRLVAGRAPLIAATSLVTTAADVVQLLPEMLGGHHRYLLALTNLSAPRGTGGYFGIYGILDCRDGEITVGPLHDTGDVPRLESPVDADSDVAKRYDRFGMRTVFWASNYSPDFPTSAQVELQIAEGAGEGDFDGVISLDSVFTAYILGAIGPVESAAWPEPVTADNAIQILNHDSFTLAQRDSDEVQRRIGQDIVNAIFARAPSIDAVAPALSLAIDERHLQVFLEEPSSQELIGRLGAAGRFELGPNPLAVVFQDYVAARTGYFVEKQIESTVVLGEDGEATTETTVSISNTAPAGPPSILLGDGSEGVPIGFAAMLANTYLPADAGDVQLRSKPTAVLLQEQEFDHPVTVGLLEADPAQDAELTTSYARPGAVTSIAGGSEFRIDYQPQASLRPVAVTVRIQLPAGSSVTTVSPGMVVDGQTVTYTGQPTTALTLWVRYRNER